MLRIYSFCLSINLFVFLSCSSNKDRSFLIKNFKTLHYKDPLMEFIYIWHDGRYRSKILPSAVPSLRPDLEVKVTDFEFSYKSQNVCT